MFQELAEKAYAAESALQMLCWGERNEHVLLGLLHGYEVLDRLDRCASPSRNAAQEDTQLRNMVLSFKHGDRYLNTRHIRDSLDTAIQSAEPDDRLIGELVDYFFDLSSCITLYSDTDFSSPRQLHDLPRSH